MYAREKKFDRLSLGVIPSPPSSFSFLASFCCTDVPSLLCLIAFVSLFLRLPFCRNPPLSLPCAFSSPCSRFFLFFRLFSAFLSFLSLFFSFFFIFFKKSSRNILRLSEKFLPLHSLSARGAWLVLWQTANTSIVQPAACHLVGFSRQSRFLLYRNTDMR